MRYLPGRLDLTLLTLIVLAFATMALARSGWVMPLVNGTVLAIAAIKGRMILLDYLGLRSAPPLWRGLATAWLLLVAGLAWAVSAASAVFS
jgi:hypothetical protein